MNEEYTPPEETISSTQDYIDMFGKEPFTTKEELQDDHVLGEVLEQQLMEN